MTTVERNALQLVQSPEGKAKACDLHYFPWHPENVARVVMLRHTNYGEADDFTCHDAETGRNLGWGADKEEAESNARHKLSDQFEAASLEGKRISYQVDISSEPILGTLVRVRRGFAQIAGDNGNAWVARIDDKRLVVAGN